MSSRKENPRTKVLSVRLPQKEAERLEVRAADSGLTRNDYLRLLLCDNDPLSDVGKLDEAITVLRQLERVLDRYLTVLEEAQVQLGGKKQAEALQHIVEEVARAQALMDLTFKAQRQAAQILRRIRRRMR